VIPQDFFTMLLPLYILLLFPKNIPDKELSSKWNLLVSVHTIVVFTLLHRPYLLMMAYYIAIHSILFTLGVREVRTLTLYSHLDISFSPIDLLLCSLVGH
jgi:hypothetical protein